MTTALATIENNNAVIENSVVFNSSLAERWLAYIRVTPKSKQTYDTAIKQMFRYFANNNITQPKREDITAWIDGLIESGKSASTVNLYLIAARRFFSFLCDDMGIYPNITRGLKSGVTVSTAHKRDALTKNQARELCNSVEGNSEKALRDRAIVALMVTAGLRTIEIVRADVADVRGGFLYVQGKGRHDKAESVRLSPQVENLIRIYLAKRQARKNEPLFVSTSNNNKGGRLTTATIRGLIKNRLRSIGLDSDRLSAHSLRHTAATIALLEGETVENVKMFLRHRNINTTQIYRHDLDRLQNFGECKVADAIFDS